MMTLPTQRQVSAAFPGGALAAAQSVHRDVRDQERIGRLMREGQVQDNCTSQHKIEASFGSGGGGTPVVQTVSFGRLAFTVEPVMTSGSQRLGLASDPLNTGFDPATHFAMPCDAQVLAYTTDSRGFFTGASVLLFALGAVPDGFRAQVNLIFTGPAIRQGTTTTTV